MNAELLTTLLVLAYLYIFFHMTLSANRSETIMWVRSIKCATAAAVLKA